MQTSNSRQPTEAMPRTTAAEHCVDAHDHFARAQQIHAETTNSDRQEYADDVQRHMEWAWMHLRFAEVITNGARLIADHRQALANPDAKVQATYLGREAGSWNDFLAGRGNGQAGEHHD